LVRVDWKPSTYVPATVGVGHDSANAKQWKTKLPADPPAVICINASAA